MFRTTSQKNILRIDPNYVPPEEDVADFAKWLGLDLEADKDLFWIAREGLVAPLPPNWKPCSDGEDIYYFNFSTGESSWNHPKDEYYKKLSEQEKEKKRKTKNTVNDGLDCCICLTATKSIVFLPCRHLCACEDCGMKKSPPIVNCPICRLSIESRMKVYT